MRIPDVPIEQAAQRSAEWFEARIGKITASRAWACADYLKSGKESADRKKLRRQLAGERLTGLPTQVYVNAAMQRGVELEPEAILDFENHHGDFEAGSVQPCGLFLHPTITNCAASPDGLIGEDGLLEVKCPGIETFIGYAEEPGTLLDEYRAQLDLQLACTGRSWVILWAYYPGLNAQWVKYERNKESIAKLEQAIILMDKEVDELVGRLR